MHVLAARGLYWREVRAACGLCEREYDGLLLTCLPVTYACSERLLVCLSPDTLPRLAPRVVLYLPIACPPHPADFAHPALPFPA